MNVQRSLIAILMAFSIAAHADESTAQSDAAKKISALDWHVGPRSEPVSGMATIKLDSPALAALGESDTATFLKLTNNLPDPGSQILFSRDHKWWAVFQFNPMGYVKDDETIDQDALLKSLKDGDEHANEERAKLNLPSIQTVGWSVPPHYDPATHLLEWGLKLRTDNTDVINYTVRMLGRDGVMNVTLVDDPESLDKDLPEFKKVLTGFEFTSGHKYAEFKPGDHVAELGLGALIVGGAAAVATKKGFWGVLGAMLATGWKFVAAGVLALGTWLKSLVGKKKP